MKKLLSALLIGLLIFSATPLLAQEEDLSPSGNLTVDDVIDVTEPEVVIIEVEPTIEYVLKNVNVGEMSRFVDYKVSINAGKKVLTDSVRNISNAITDVERKYASVVTKHGAEGFDGETIALHESFVAAAKAYKDAGANLATQLESVWRQYNA